MGEKGFLQKYKKKFSKQILLLSQIFVFHLKKDLGSLSVLPNRDATCALVIHTYIHGLFIQNLQCE